MRMFINALAGVVAGGGCSLIIRFVSIWFAVPVAVVFVGLLAWLKFLDHIESCRTIREAAVQTQRPQSDFKVRGTSLRYDGKRIRGATVMSAVDLCAALGVEPWGYLKRRDAQ